MNNSLSTAAVHPTIQKVCHRVPGKRKNGGFGSIAVVRDGHETSILATRLVASQADIGLVRRATRRVSAKYSGAATLAALARRNVENT